MRSCLISIPLGIKFLAKKSKMSADVYAKLIVKKKLEFPKKMKISPLCKDFITS